jgi:hypothetical protein
MQSVDASPMNEEENWRDIPTYEGLYQVNEAGQVKSLRQNVILKPSDKDGYCLVCLTNHAGDRTSLGVHQLVIWAFQGVRSDGNLAVNHKDSNRKNNRLSNLELITRTQNTRHIHNKTRYMDERYVFTPVHEFESLLTSAGKWHYFEKGATRSLCGFIDKAEWQDFAGILDQTETLECGSCLKRKHVFQTKGKFSSNY